jgi:mRNA-degrading endonuclease RelE of RelBE toxin-antitoxin system
LAEELPKPVAAACFEFVFGPLAGSPFLVGVQLNPPLWPSYSARRGEYRVIYEIDEARHMVFVNRIRHRRDAYKR